jgi:amino acid transporter
MLGAGIFVSPGYIAAELTGPALFVAYLIAVSVIPVHQSVHLFASSLVFLKSRVDDGGGHAQDDASANSQQAVPPALPACLLACPLQAVSAYLSSFCYAEFAVSMPLAGAAYNYIVSALGEFIAWVSRRGGSAQRFVHATTTARARGVASVASMWWGGRASSVMAPQGRVYGVSTRPTCAL